MSFLKVFGPTRSQKFMTLFPRLMFGIMVLAQASQARSGKFYINVLGMHKGVHVGIYTGWIGALLIIVACILGHVDILPGKWQYFLYAGIGALFAGLSISLISNWSAKTGKQFSLGEVALHFTEQVITRSTIGMLHYAVSVVSLVFLLPWWACLSIIACDRSPLTFGIWLLFHGVYETHSYKKVHDMEKYGAGLLTRKETEDPNPGPCKRKCQSFKQLVGKLPCNIRFMFTGKYFAAWKTALCPTNRLEGRTKGSYAEKLFSKTKKWKKDMRNTRIKWYGFAMFLSILSAACLMSLSIYGMYIDNLALSMTGIVPALGYILLPVLILCYGEDEVQQTGQTADDLVREGVEFVETLTNDNFDITRADSIWSQAAEMEDYFRGTSEMEEMATEIAIIRSEYEKCGGNIKTLQESETCLSSCVTIRTLGELLKNTCPKEPGSSDPAYEYSQSTSSIRGNNLRRRVRRLAHLTSDDSSLAMPMPMGQQNEL